MSGIEVQDQEVIKHCMVKHSSYKQDIYSELESLMNLVQNDQEDLTLRRGEVRNSLMEINNIV